MPMNRDLAVYEMKAIRQRPSAERIQQFWEVATQIVAAAPAFMCNGRLNGAAAAFADCLAVAMLSDPDAAAARTTAA